MDRFRIPCNNNGNGNESNGGFCPQTIRIVSSVRQRLSLERVARTHIEIAGADIGVAQYLNAYVLPYANSDPTGHCEITPAMCGTTASRSSRHSRRLSRRLRRRRARLTMSASQPEPGSCGSTDGLIY